ncbi:metal ABC transporter solute-binding protein, Zn/Mn family [Raineya orbicola]|jgi:manganese/zinc/iron transport system substrate-binding protein|uniref:ABC-type metal ion transport system periplasmic component/surface adhesin n=1 Tax=Raineya orbicola TaxID=2016530 RepID=A0A2N3I9F2_9BACT|nr:zinc ABC transporter substrate-binding protein [Raineya orbicola]PKQ66888.1 ABC-type metal ion transport system periplasmic component/surface adhesin [Raineya orbicola]
MNKVRNFKVYLKVVFCNYLFFIVLTSCQNIQVKEKYILTTTQMLYDVVINLVDSTFEVDFLMGEGTDPHLYKFSQIDLRKLNKAKVVINNGLHLEGKMNFIFQKISKNKIVVSVGDSLDKKYLISVSDKIHDPHIWFDIELWKEVVKVVSSNLQKEFPKEKMKIQKKEKSYIQQLNNLQEFVRNEIEKIPPKQRVLITSHDAFRYFEKSWNFQVKALQGISTTAEYGLKDIQDLVDFISQNNIKAVFVETSLPSKGLEAVMKGIESKGKKIKVIEGLYSDAMGAIGTFEGTYIGMYKSNVQKIVEALK